MVSKSKPTISWSSVLAEGFVESGTMLSLDACHTELQQQINHKYIQYSHTRKHSWSINLQQGFTTVGFYTKFSVVHTCHVISAKTLPVMHADISSFPLWNFPKRVFPSAIDRPPSMLMSAVFLTVKKKFLDPTEITPKIYWFIALQ